MIGQDPLDPRYPPEPTYVPPPPGGGAPPGGDRMPQLLMGLGLAISTAGFLFRRPLASLSGGIMVGIGAMRYDWKQWNPLAGYGMQGTAKGFYPPLGIPGVAPSEGTFPPSFQGIG